MTKEHRYAALVDARHVCAACDGLCNPAAVAAGQFDSRQIGPWTTWQNRLDASVMVVGQDFSDVSYFVRWHGRDQPNNATNRNLVALLHSVGVEIDLPESLGGRNETFFTNAILCLKTGGMQARVRPEWFANCGQRFLRPQIELVRPKVVVCLGQRALDAVLAAFGLPQQRLRDAVTSPGTPVLEQTLVIAVYHCGARVTRLTRSHDRQLEDWKRVASALRLAAA
jgi:DNA polymerase